MRKANSEKRGQTNQYTPEYVAVVEDLSMQIKSGRDRLKPSAVDKGPAARSVQDRRDHRENSFSTCSSIVEELPIIIENSTTLVCDSFAESANDLELEDSLVGTKKSLAARDLVDSKAPRNNISQVQAPTQKSNPFTSSRRSKKNKISLVTLPMTEQLSNNSNDDKSTTNESAPPSSCLTTSQITQSVQSTSAVMVDTEVSVLVSYNSTFQASKSPTVNHDSKEIFFCHAHTDTQTETLGNRNYQSNSKQQNAAEIPQHSSQNAIYTSYFEDNCELTVDIARNLQLTSSLPAPRRVSKNGLIPSKFAALTSSNIKQLSQHLLNDRADCVQRIDVTSAATRVDQPLLSLATDELWWLEYNRKLSHDHDMRRQENFAILGGSFFRTSSWSGRRSSVVTSKSRRSLGLIGASSLVGTMSKQLNHTDHETEPSTTTAESNRSSSPSHHFDDHGFTLNSEPLVGLRKSPHPSNEFVIYPRSIDDEITHPTVGVARRSSTVDSYDDKVALVHKKPSYYNTIMSYIGNMFRRSY